MNKKEWSKFKTEFYGRNLRHLRFIKKYATDNCEKPEPCEDAIVELELDEM